MLSPQLRAARTAVLVIVSYGAVGLVDGLLFHNRYHENALILVIAMSILVFGAPPPHWRIALAGCLALALLDAVLTSVVGQVVGLEEPASFARLLRNVRAGVLAGGMYSVLAWRWHRRQAAIRASSGSSTA